MIKKIVLIPLPYILALFIQLVFSFFLFLNTQGNPTVTTSSLVLLLKGMVSLFYFSIWYYFLVRNGNAFKNKSNWNLHYSSAIWIIVLGICLQLLLAFILNVVISLLKSGAESYMSSVETLFNYSVATIIYVSVIAPIGEELIFRGITFQYAKRILPGVIANLIQAVLFGVYHGNIYQGVYAFVAGLFFGFIMTIFRSIWASILLHCSLNIAGLILSKLSFALSVYECIILAFVFFIICFILIRKIYYLSGRNKSSLRE